MFNLFITLLSLGSTLGIPSSKYHVSTLDGRIVGGRDADIADYPYQISLLYDEYQYCGGAIISPTWVVTAAHCVGDDDPNFLVRAGSSLPETGGEVIEISQITVHPNFDDNLDYDIALIKLSWAISADNASAISLPRLGNENTTIPEGIDANVTGWGDIDEELNSPDVLQVVEVPIVSQEDCRSAYAGYNVTDRMFCAGYIETGGKDACQGDSGGPVVADGVLIGLVSWGIGCAEPHYPGVYTNVLALRSWINEITCL